MGNSIDRKKVYKKFKGRCAYCGERIDFNKFQVDHIHPRARKYLLEPGDINKINNLNPACIPCNVRKSSMTIDKFRKQLSRDVMMLKRDTPKFNTVLRYKQVKVLDNPIMFYFEKG